MARRRVPRGFGRRRVSRGSGPWGGLIVLALLTAAGVAWLEDQRGADPALSEARGCRVVYVVDGDTVQMRCPARGMFRARLVGYDAPEVFSPACDEEREAGREATRALRAMLEEAEDLDFAFGEADEYGRTLVTLTADGADVARSMIAAGHGRRYQGGEGPDWCG